MNTEPHPEHEPAIALLKQITSVAETYERSLDCEALVDLIDLYAHHLRTVDDDGTVLPFERFVRDRSALAAAAAAAERASGEPTPIPLPLR